MDRNKYILNGLIEWTATFLTIAGVFLTSFNCYPANLYVGMLGNFIWVIVAIQWRKWSLLVIQVVITIIYLTGILSVH